MGERKQPTEPPEGIRKPNPPPAPPKRDFTTSKLRKAGVNERPTTLRPADPPAAQAPAKCFREEGYPSTEILFEPGDDRDKLVLLGSALELTVKIARQAILEDLAHRMDTYAAQCAPGSAAKKLYSELATDALIERNSLSRTPLY